MSDSELVVVGNLTADPELKYLPGGAAVAQFTIASTPRTFDKSCNEWKSGETLFMRCSAWRNTAINVKDSLHRGTRVVARGRLQQRSYETASGEKRIAVELLVDEIGPTLRTAVASVTPPDNPATAVHQSDDSAPGDVWGTPWAEPVAAC